MPTLTTMPPGSKTPANTIKSAVVQTDHVTVSFKDGKTFSLDKTSPTWKLFRRALKFKRGDLVRKYANAADAIKTWAEGHLTIEGGTNVLYRGKLVSSKMHAKILSLIDQKKPVKYLAAFLDNLHKNPSEDAISDLYDFLEANNLPLTEDGHFLAFKRIRDNFKDHHTNSMDNSVGKVVEMRREKVNANRHDVCSTGLHFAQAGYLDAMGGGKTVILKINPADVVSIPTDYNRMKGRACKYTVLAEVGNANPQEALNKAAVATSTVKRKDIGKKK